MSSPFERHTNASRRTCFYRPVSVFRCGATSHTKSREGDCRPYDVALSRTKRHSPHISRLEKYIHVDNLGYDVVLSQFTVCKKKRPSRATYQQFYVQSQRYSMRQAGIEILNAPQFGLYNKIKRWLGTLISSWNSWARRLGLLQMYLIRNERGIQLG